MKPINNIRQLYVPTESPGPFKVMITFVSHIPCRAVGLYLFGVDPETRINGFRFGNCETFGSPGQIPATLFSSTNRDPIDLQQLVKANDLQIERNHYIDGLVMDPGTRFSILIEGEVKHAALVVETYDDPCLCRRRIVINDVETPTELTDGNAVIRDIRYCGKAFKETLRGEVCILEVTAGSEEVCAMLLRDAYERPYYR